MSNELKKFIRDNREAFDDKEPSAMLWGRIESNLVAGPEKRSIIRPLYKWAMGAAAMLVIAASVYFFVVNGKPAEPSVVINEPDSNTGITPEINQIVKMIGMKQEELKTLAAGQPELYRQFSNDLDQLDSSYNALKSELNETPNQELLLEAMIQNLQLQLNVLNQQLNIINQIKQSKKYSHEKKDQSI